MARENQKKIKLALQGGGAHGAFTWGVLDWLLENEKLQIEAISGTSAGAMNAVVLADGLAKGGEDGAREALRNFWQSVSKASHMSPFQRSPIDVFFGNWSLDNSVPFMAWDLVSRVASPYQLNPLNYNPLRELVESQIDFERVRRCDRVEVYVAATNVRTGKIKIFTDGELTADAVLASSCLPTVYQAVEIDGEAYWDGGFMGNPPLFPLFKRSPTTDVLLIQINPVAREELPKTAQEIAERLNEITFNSTLLRELRAIEFVSRLLEQGKLDANHYTKVFMHRIEATHDLLPFGSSSKLNPQLEFIELLFEIGRNAAKKWSAENYEHLGERSTLDLEREFS
ncbi:patatin-like phospholipase family protein [Pseudovibrio exalbescens]|uniref:patatin-like phospholipase family protein n=1 Tax=Pseudovibrio exalbescens TaxID=197461 RepID=UPI0023661E9D|nr:patatin-like phospholipase family protein [Pseudovibrio exalbescens]MDD7909354.1 patatin-like phospholipase family protein [Pseudovibrio exalbescens]